jgi:hypothetical protein
MTGDEQEVAVPSVTRASAALSEVATQVGQALSRLTAALGGTAGAFGSDEISGPFARQYLPMVDQAAQAIASYQKQVEYASRGLAGTADLLQHTESLNAADLARLRAPWRPPAAQ